MENKILTDSLINSEIQSLKQISKKNNGIPLPNILHIWQDCKEFFKYLKQKNIPLYRGKPVPFELNNFPARKDLYNGQFQKD